MRPAGGDNSVPEQRPSGHTTCPQWVCVSSTVMGAYESCFRKQEGNKPDAAHLAQEPVSLPTPVFSCGSGPPVTWGPSPPPGD